MLQVGMYEVPLDFVITSSNTGIGVVSFYDRSLSLVKAVGASLSSHNEMLQVGTEKGKIRYDTKDNMYNTIIQAVVNGKEKFYHAIAFNKALNDTMLLVRKNEEGRIFFNYLMAKFDLPLLAEWGKPLFDYSIEKGLVSADAYQGILKGRYSVTDKLNIGQDSVSLDELDLYEVNISNDSLKEMVSNLLERGEIKITPEKQEKLEFKNLDEYITKYGSTLVDNLRKEIVPVIPLNGNVSDFTLKGMRLFPQQAAQVNGAIALLEKESNYVIFNNDMGTGKTIVSASCVEGYFIRKYRRKYPKMSLKDIYSDRELVSYRVVVMCPGHLLEKWAAELNDQIPYAKVKIIREFSDLLEIRKNGRKRSGKEWFIISKDFSKLSYQLKPLPTKMRLHRVVVKQCADCGTTYNGQGHTCPRCNSRKYVLKDAGYKTRGMICPHCGQLLYPYKTNVLELGGSDLAEPLTYMDFTKRNTENAKCYYCEEELWGPHTSLLGKSKKKISWIRATHYANKAHKAKTTVWVHKDFKREYFHAINEEPLKIDETDIEKGARKYSPAEFIRKYLKGFFDIAIFDEVHELKGGGTGQGMAMHALVRATKKQIALTGTIAGGYATNMFYLLYRLDPRRMRKFGFEFNQELKFAEKYGKTEKEFDYENVDVKSEYNAACKGRQIGSVRVKPGISPLIYMDFLLDSATNLNLSDMSKYLPKLHETVVGVNPDEEQLYEYNRVIDDLKELSRVKGMGGRGLLSIMLQFSLSYLDKPFNQEEIKSPITGDVIEEPRSLERYKTTDIYDDLLPKEKKLIELINNEIAENRCCFVYAEYTNSPNTCVTYRLQEIIEKYCNLKGKVAVLESASPKATERELWIKKQAALGIKVVITNPKCVSTGLDFAFKYQGKAYNFPTIIFYQMGYNMYTVSQAAKRHYRLNQREECRTYYMCYTGTTQKAAVELIAEKQVSTAAIQGKFSSGALAAMANGVDTRLQLAKSLAEKDTTSVDELQNMFDVLADNRDDDTYSKYKPMTLFSELVGKETAAKENKKEGDIDIIDLWSMFDIHMDSVHEESSNESLSQKEVETKPKRNKKVKEIVSLEGQVSLF